MLYHSLETYKILSDLRANFTAKDRNCRKW